MTSLPGTTRSPIIPRARVVLVMGMVLIIVGLIALFVGAEVLVGAASSLADAVGLPTLVIGLTVVAYGTSAPELAVSTKAAWMGQPEIAVGNVVGSNIFNVLFILGVSALVAPLTISSRLIRFEVPLMIGLSVVTWVVAMDGVISRVEGGFFCVGLVLYTAFLILGGRRGSGHVVAVNAPRVTAAGGVGRSIFLVVCGLALLAIGGSWFVQGAVVVARHWGVSERFIGLTMVAAGTSLPEVATSVLASVRGQRDIAVGNIVGSNIFNLLGVLGVSAAAAPNALSVPWGVLQFDLPVMLAVAVVCLPIFFTGGRVSRLEGALLFGYYGMYVMCLVLSATQQTTLGTFSSAMRWFVIPLSAMGIGVSVLVGWRRRRCGG